MKIKNAGASLHETKQRKPGKCDSPVKVNQDNTRNHNNLFYNNKCQPMIHAVALDMKDKMKGLHVRAEFSV